MRPRSFVLLSLVAQGAVCLAQVNLVPNPGFESFSTCPVGFSEFNGFINNWTDPSAASPDYMNSCANPFPAGVPHNGTGWQQPHGGNAYAGCYTTAGTYREFIQVQLTAPLVAGTSYVFTMYVVLHNKSKWATDDLGAYFSLTAPTSASTGFLAGSPLPQVANAFGNVITDSLNWTPISGTYIATGGERFLTLGHFRDDASSTYIQVDYGGQGAYYYFDDVSVEALSLLPIELLGFSAKSLTRSIQLDWATAVEIDNSGFQLQRSGDGERFEPIAWLPGSGTSAMTHSYTYEDKDVQPGITYYYRLKQVDSDGAFQWSPTVSAALEAWTTFGAYYSSSTGELVLDLPHEGLLLVDRYDARGTLVRSEQETLSAGTVRLPIANSLAEGLNLLRLSFAGESKSIRVIH